MASAKPSAKPESATVDGSHAWIAFGKTLFAATNPRAKALAIWPAPMNPIFVIVFASK
jgi:hypothetical protein